MSGDVTDHDSVSSIGAVSRSEHPRERYARWLLLALGLCALASVKLLYNPYPIGRHSDDGSLYFQVARHIANGDGLKTSVSLYNAGLRPLPHATHIYPLWPLVLGYTGRAIGLLRAAVIVPEILYFVALILLYSVVNSVARPLGDPVVFRVRGVGIVDIGHITVAVFAINPVFFKYTSLPFTEGLAYSLLFAALIVIITGAARSSGVIALCGGALLGLAFLARSQMLGALVSVPLVLALCARRGPRLALFFVVGSLGIVAPWLLYIRHQFGPAMNASMLLDFTKYQMTPELDPFEWKVTTHGIGPYLADRVLGLAVAFWRNSQFSYIASFGDVAYVPFVALVVLAVRFFRLQSGRVSALLSLRTRYIAPIVVAVAGLFLLAPIHMVRASRYGGWFFQFRQGLPLILLIVAGLALLLTGNRWLRIAALVLVASLIVHSVSADRQEFQRHSLYGAPSIAEQELADWIHREAGDALFATVGANPLGAITEGCFHDVQPDASRAQMLVFFDLIGVDYVVSRKPLDDAPNLARVRDRLTLYRSFGEGDERLDVWRVLQR